MKIYISADIEGVTGIAHWDENMGVRSYNITKDMLYWPHDQTITDRICKEQFIASPPEEMPSRRSSLMRKTLLISSGVLSLVVKRYHFILHAYCLMNNHYHLLMETP